MVSVVVIWSSSVSIARRCPAVTGGRAVLGPTARLVPAGGPGPGVLPQRPDPCNANDAAVLVSSVVGRNRGVGVQPPGGWEWHP